MTQPSHHPDALKSVGETASPGQGERDLLAAATPRPWAVDDQLDVKGSDGSLVAPVEWRDDDTDNANAAVIVVAVNEHEALNAIAQYAKHVYGCAATRTNGGLSAPGKCDCGLDDWRVRLAALRSAT